MNGIINFTILFLIIVEYFTFFYTILRRRLKLFSKRWIIGGVVIFVGMIGLSFGEWRLVSLYFLGMFLSACIICLIFDGLIIDTVKLYLVAYPSLSILEAIDLYFIESFFNIGEKTSAIPCMGSIVIILWLYYWILGKKLEGEAFQMGNEAWLIISVIMLLILGLISYFTYILKKVSGSKEQSVGLVMVTVGGFTIFVLNYVMLYYFNNKQKYQMRSDILEQYNEQQRQYFEMLLQKEQDTRQFRHDITAHLLQIQNFCEKGIHEEEMQYISALLLDIKKLNKRGYEVGNEIINTILNTYLVPLESICDIKVKGFVDSDIGIEKKDMCVIVSNLVKNAVEAVEQSTAERKLIVFEANQGDHFFSVKVKNTAEKHKILIQDHYPITKKEEKHAHGFGIRNIDSIAEKYHGNYQFQVEDGYYIAEVYLKVNRLSTK